MSLSRRHLLRISAGAALGALTASRAHAGGPPCSATLSDFERIPGFEGRDVFRIRGASGPSVVVLHELPGMSRHDMALGRCLANEGFTAWMPLMFGKPEQFNLLLGYTQSCAGSEFVCSTSSRSSPIVRSLRVMCERIADMSGGPVGAIGMCLTGIFPLALLSAGVQAAVLCQPTVPFSPIGRPIGDQKTDLGLDPSDLEDARRSGVPVLALRYTRDPKCPTERIQRLRQVFQERIAVGELPGNGHSTLAEHFERRAFADTVKYLGVRLGRTQGPQTMELVRLNDRPCEITVEGRWRAVRS